MTENEFWDELREFREQFFLVETTGKFPRKEIRTSQKVCPLCAVANKKFNAKLQLDYDEASKLLSLPFSFTTPVSIAADGYEDANPAIVEKLYETLALGGKY